MRPPTSWEAARLPQQVFDACIRGDGALSTGTPGRGTTHSALRDIVQIVDDRVLTFDPEEKDASRAFVERGFVPPGTKRYKDRRFIFDRVFRHDASQTEVYGGTARPLLKTLLDGFNTTIFAYGVRLSFYLLLRSDCGRVVGVLMARVAFGRLRDAGRRTRLAGPTLTRASST